MKTDSETFALRHTDLYIIAAAQVGYALWLGGFMNVIVFHNGRPVL